MEKIKLPGVKIKDFKKRKQIQSSNLRYGEVRLYTDADSDG